MTSDDFQLHTVTLLISNMANVVSRGPLFPIQGYGLPADHSIVIDDGRWWDGSVFNFRYECDECGKRLFMKEKIIK